MSAQHWSHGATAAPTAPADRDRHAWIAPTVATVLLLFLAPAALLFGGLSAMATDSCGPDDCPDALMTQLTVIYSTLTFGGIVTLGAWLASWVLPWTPRWSGWRSGLAALALLPPVLVLLLVFSLPMP
ncbi:hypothetical protein ACGFZL_15160 [Streptomyces sp. NPDC048182]|uniref:hypothetical protein n=1 Tax=Streptomyces sp. NPDC048182 TaxID=3365507 RepID=UPI00371BDE68